MATSKMDVGAAREKVRDLLHAYARAIDDGRYEEWPEFFLDNGEYFIIPRENLNRGSNFAVFSCFGKGMMKDRARVLNQATVYNIHFPRRMISNIEVSVAEDGTAEAFSNYTVYQSDQEGRTILYSVGQYRDTVSFVEGEAKFAKKIVILDTFGIPNLIAVPI